MKKASYLFLLFASLFFLSCVEEDNDITLTINESGSLEIKLIDDDNNPVKNVSVTLRGLTADAVAFSGTVDETGVLKIEKLLQGYYTAYTKIEKDGITYSSITNFQIIVKDKKKIEINPFSNSGKLNISVDVQGSVNDLTQYTVALVPYEQSISNVNQIKAYAYFSTNLASDGKAEFLKVPAERNYYLIIYKDAAIYGYQIIYKTKEDQPIAMTLYAGKILLSVKGSVQDFTKYEVYITPYSGEARSIENIKETAQFSGKLDSEGKASFSEISIDRSSDWDIYLIKDNQIYDKKNIYYPSFNPIMEISLSVGSLTLDVRGSFQGGRENYSIAIVKYGESVNNVQQLESKAILKRKLSAEGTITFSEIPLQSGSYYYVYLYKDNRIYSYDSFSWYGTDLSTYVYLSAYEY